MPIAITVLFSGVLASSRVSLRPTTLPHPRTQNNNKAVKAQPKKGHTRFFRVLLGLISYYQNIPKIKADTKRVAIALLELDTKKLDGDDDDELP